MFDLRFLTGPAMLLMGGFLIFVAFRLWRVHPVNRVFRLGPYVTEAGMVALLNLRFAIMSYGLFLFAQGMASAVFWYVRRAVDDPLVQFMGSLSAGLGIWAAAITARLFLHLYGAR